MAPFALQWQKWVVVIDTVWPGKYKMFTIWHFTRKVANPFYFFIRCDLSQLELFSSYLGLQECDLTLGWVALGDSECLVNKHVSCCALLMSPGISHIPKCWACVLLFSQMPIKWLVTISPFLKLVPFSKDSRYCFLIHENTTLAMLNKWVRPKGNFFQRRNYTEEELD